MKAFLKIFLIAFVCFSVAMGAGLWAYSHFVTSSTGIVIQNAWDGDTTDIVDTVEKAPDHEQEEIKEEEEEEVIEKSLLEKLMEESKRVNVLLLGMEGPRTDTIVLASFDPVHKKVDLISIPRDTYYYRKGYGSADKRKINAVYGDAGVKGTMAAVSNVLGGVPIDHYVKVTYTGVRRIIDSMGGIKVNVPIRMVYDDPYDKPPLHINIPKGSQVLKGDKAIQFLRFRKNNDGSGYPDGDLGRIRAQQQFMKAAMSKAIGLRLPIVANTAFKQIKTDMSLSDVLSYAKGAVGITTEDVKTYSLPGRATMKNGASYFLHDPKKVEDLMIEIYEKVRE